MRKLRIFVVEVVLAGLVVGWTLLKFPDKFDQWIPWMVVAILWHLLYECVWQSDGGKVWRSKNFPSAVIGWVFFFLVSLVICVPLWLSARAEFRKLVASVPSNYPAPPPQSSSVPDSPTHTDLQPAITDTITTESEYDFATFVAKCDVPCHFNKGVVVGSDSKIEPLPQGKDLTIAGARVVEPVRLKKGQKLMLEYTAIGGGPIKLIWGGRGLTAKGQVLGTAPQPCRLGHIHIGEMVSTNVTNGIVTQGEVPCIQVDKEITITGKAAFNVNPQSDPQPSPPTSKLPQ